MESHLYLLWQVDIRNSVKSDLQISKEYHVSFSELKALPYFQYEWIVSDIIEEQKKLEEKRKEQEANQKMPKTPKYTPPKMPKISVPRFK